MKQISRTIEKLLELAPQCMATASAIAMRHYQATGVETKVLTKADDSPLTLADLQVDAHVGRFLSEQFHDIPVVTEERASSHRQGFADGVFFLVDPIDGTKEFINKRDEFTINIALVDSGKPVAGIVCAPALETCYFGAVGEGAWECKPGNSQKKPIGVAVPDNKALRVVASRSHLTDETKAFIDANSVSECMNAGSSLKFCLLARGEADLYPRFGTTMEWDTAAGHAVLLSAGGFVLTMDGAPLSYGKKNYRNSWFVAGAEGVKYTMPGMPS